MNGVEQVSQAAEFFRVQDQERKNRIEESKNFRRGMAALAAVAGAKVLFGRRGS